MNTFKSANSIQKAFKNVIHPSLAFGAKMENGQTTTVENYIHVEQISSYDSQFVINLKFPFPRPKEQISPNVLENSQFSFGSNAAARRKREDHRRSALKNKPERLVQSIIRGETGKLRKRIDDAGGVASLVKFEVNISGKAGITETIDGEITKKMSTAAHWMNWSAAGVTKTVSNQAS